MWGKATLGDLSCSRTRAAAQDRGGGGDSLSRQGTIVALHKLSFVAYLPESQLASSLNRMTASWPQPQEILFTQKVPSMVKHSLWKASLPPHPGWQVGSGYDTLGNPLSLFLSELDTFKGRGPLRNSWSHTGDEVQVFKLATSVLGSALLSVQELVGRDSYFNTPFRPWLFPVQKPDTCLFQDL